MVAISGIGASGQETLIDKQSYEMIQNQIYKDGYLDNVSAKWLRFQVREQLDTLVAMTSEASRIDRLHFIGWSSIIEHLKCILNERDDVVMFTVYRDFLNLVLHFEKLELPANRQSQAGS